MRLTHRLAAVAALAFSAAGCDSAATADAATASDVSASVAAAPAAAVADSTDSDTAATALFARADLGRIDGPPSAAVWLVVISDFQCPFCKRWHEETGPRIHAEYVKTGKVRIAYLNLPISSHRNALPAHEAAMCAAEQGRFWPVADALFATQERWKNRSNVQTFFDSLTVPLVGDVPRYRSCITNGATRTLIDADVARVQRIGVGSTPTFVVGQQLIIGAQPYDVFRRALDAAIAGAASR